MHHEHVLTHSHSSPQMMPTTAAAAAASDGGLFMANGEVALCCLEELQEEMRRHINEIKASPSISAAAEKSVEQIKHHLLRIQSAVEYRVQHPFQPTQSPATALQSVCRRRTTVAAPAVPQQPMQQQHVVVDCAAAAATKAAACASSSYSTTSSSLTDSVAAAVGSINHNNNTNAATPIVSRGGALVVPRPGSNNSMGHVFSDFERVRLGHLFFELKMYIRLAMECVLTIVVPPDAWEPSKRPNASSSMPQPQPSPPHAHAHGDEVPAPVCRTDNQALSLSNHRSSSPLGSSGNRSAGSRRDTSSSTSASLPPPPPPPQPPQSSASPASMMQAAGQRLPLHRNSGAHDARETSNDSGASGGTRTTACTSRSRGGGTHGTSGSSSLGAKKVLSSCSSQNTPLQVAAQQLSPSSGGAREPASRVSSSAASLSSQNGGRYNETAYSRSASLLRRPRKLDSTQNHHHNQQHAVSTYYLPGTYSLSVGGPHAHPSSDSPHSSLSGLPFKRVVSMSSEPLTSATGTEWAADDPSSSLVQSDEACGPQDGVQQHQQQHQQHQQHQQQQCSMRGDEGVCAALPTTPNNRGTESDGGQNNHHHHQLHQQQQQQQRQRNSFSGACRPVLAQDATNVCVPNQTTTTTTTTTPRASPLLATPSPTTTTVVHPSPLASSGPYAVDELRVVEFIRCIEDVDAAYAQFTDSEFSHMRLRYLIPGLAAVAATAATTPSKSNINGRAQQHAAAPPSSPHDPNNNNMPAGFPSLDSPLCDAATGVSFDSGGRGSSSSRMLFPLLPGGEGRPVTHSEFPVFKALVFAKIMDVERVLGRPLSGRKPSFTQQQ